MVYALVYVEHADLIADFDSYDEAKATLDALSPTTRTPAISAGASAIRCSPSARSDGC